MHIARILRRILGDKAIQTIRCFTESNSLVEHLQTSHQLANRAQQNYMARLRQQVDEKFCTIEWIPGTEQIADVMTKRGVRPDSLRNAITR